MPLAFADSSLTWLQRRSTVLLKPRPHVHLTTRRMTSGDLLKYRNGLLIVWSYHGREAPRVFRLTPRSEGDDLAGMNRVVRSDDDLQALNRVVHVIGEIDILVDRL
jgi:hypothetical protein